MHASSADTIPAPVSQSASPLTAGTCARVRQRAEQVLRVIFNRRLLLPGEQDRSVSFTREAELHQNIIAAAIERHQPLNLILPGFPAKSPNRNKTLSPLPDLAEKHALHNLDLLCQEIETLHAPGAYVTICSDGRVFADLVRIPDQDVTAYGAHLKEYSHRTHPNRFRFFDLEHVYPEVKDHSVLREELLVQYGESIYQLRKRCQADEEARAMYLGITRFILEDYSGIEIFQGESRTALQKLARSIAYRVIQRSNAWTRLLENHFGDAIRLSIHPQFRISRKIGIKLGDAEDCWLTPWHGVAMKKEGRILLLKRRDAEKVGLLAFEDGRPSHFEHRGGATQ